MMYGCNSEKIDVGLPSGTLKGLQAYKVSEWFKVNKVSNPMIENLLA